MNYYCYLLITFLINLLLCQTQITKFKFEPYPFNIEGKESIKSFISHSPGKLDNLDLDDFIFRLFDDFYFNLTLGTPPQIIPAIWDMGEHSFQLYNQSFNVNNSSSFKQISSAVLSQLYDKSKEAILCEDKFYFIDENNNSFSNMFNFVKLEYDKNYAFVGLQLPNYLENLLVTFTISLKKYKIIDNEIFFIYYDINQNTDDIMKYSGNIYFGDYPHNIKEFSNTFNENEFYEIKAAYRYNLVYWDILFNNIYFDDSYNLADYKQAAILGNLRLSIGTDEYMEFITKNFFDEYTKNNICQLKTIINNEKYLYYKCKNNPKLFNIAKFPNLNFEIRDIRFNFTFTYEDLFFTYNDYIYFGIIFDKYFYLKYNKDWKLGSALFKKYLLTFNKDKKMIGIYKNTIGKTHSSNLHYINGKDISNDNNLNNINNYEYNKIFMVICLMIVVIILGIILIKYLINYHQNKNSKKINYQKKSSAYYLKNKKEIHEYFELESGIYKKV